MEKYDDLGEIVPCSPHRPTRAEINLENLLFNLNSIRKRLSVGSGSEIIAVVKADAYGHGIEAVETLQNEGVRYFAVAFCDEAVALRQQGIDAARIMLLGHTAIDLIPEIVNWEIEPAVYQLDFAKALSDYCMEEGVVCPVHIKVDTGMGRIGWRWDEATEAIAELSTYPGISLAGIFTHFATADEVDKSFTKLQLDRFVVVLNELKDMGIHIPLRHVQNSAAIIDFKHPVYNGVRPGIILYGLYPSDEVNKENLSLRPVMSFMTKIVHIKTIHAGDSLGYGRAYIATEDRRIATLPVGYADGYTRMLSGKGAEVFLCGKRAPIVGNICMDQCTIDITDIPEAVLGSDVELFGEHLPVEELAQKLGTINYELVCMVNKRVPRVYEFLGDRHVRTEILNTGYFGDYEF